MRPQTAKSLTLHAKIEGLDVAGSTSGGSGSSMVSSWMRHERPVENASSRSVTNRFQASFELRRKWAWSSYISSELV